MGMSPMQRSQSNSPAVGDPATPVNACWLRFTVLVCSGELGVLGTEWTDVLYREGHKNIMRLTRVGLASAHLDEDKLTRELRAEVGSDPVLLPVLLPAGEGGGATLYCKSKNICIRFIRLFLI